MRIKILYFASLREAIKITQEEVDLPATVADSEALRHWLIARGEPFASTLAYGKAVRTAVAHQLRHEATALSEGVEVAFFPPVTGG